MTDFIDDAMLVGCFIGGAFLIGVITTFVWDWLFGPDVPYEDQNDEFKNFD